MKYILISIFLLWVGLSWCSAHSLSKIALKNPTDLVYKLEEGADGSSLTLSSPALEQPSLREIVYYHMIERPYEKYVAHSDADDDDDDDDDEEENINEKSDFDDKETSENPEVQTTSEGSILEEWVRSDADDDDDDDDDEEENINEKSDFDDKETSENPEVQTTSEGSILEEWVRSAPKNRFKREVKDVTSKDISNENKSDYLSNGSIEDKDKSNSKSSESTEKDNNDSKTNESGEKNEKEHDSSDNGSKENDTNKDNSNTSVEIDENKDDPKKNATYGMSLHGHEGIVWNNLTDPTYVYHVQNGDSNANINGLDSDSQSDSNESDSSGSENSSNNSNSDSDSNESPEENSSSSADSNSESASGSESDSSESDSSSGEESAEGNPTDDSSEKEAINDLMQMLGGGGADNNTLNIPNEDTKDEVNFFTIVQDLHDLFAKTNSSIINLPEKPNHSNIIGILHDVFTSLKDVANLPANNSELVQEVNIKPGFVVQEDPKKPIFNVLQGIFAKIIQNKITINENVDSKKNVDIVENKESITAEEKDPMDNKHSTLPYEEPTENPDVTKISNPNENIDSGEHRISEERDEVETTTNSISSGDSNSSESGESSDRPEKSTEDKENESNEPNESNSNEPEKSSSSERDNEESNKIPVGKHKEPCHNNEKGLDNLVDLMNNEKFWNFMGDLAGKYLEKMMERTSALIKQEIEAKVKDYIEKHKHEMHGNLNNEDRTPVDIPDSEDSSNTPRRHDKNPKDKDMDLFHVNASTIYGNTIGNDKVTNVFIFYANNSSDVAKYKEYMKNANNATNIFTFGSKDKSDDGDVGTTEGPMTTSGAGSSISRTEQTTTSEVVSPTNSQEYTEGPLSTIETETEGTITTPKADSENPNDDDNTIVTHINEETTISDMNTSEIGSTPLIELSTEPSGNSAAQNYLNNDVTEVTEGPVYNTDSEATTISGPEEATASTAVSNDNSLENHSADGQANAITPDNEETKSVGPDSSKENNEESNTLNSSTEGTTVTNEANDQTENLVTPETNNIEITTINNEENSESPITTTSLDDNQSTKTPISSAEVAETTKEPTDSDSSTPNDSDLTNNPNSSDSSITSDDKVNTNENTEAPNANEDSSTPNANEDSSTPNANEDSSTPNANEDSSTPNANEDSSTPNSNEDSSTPNANEDSSTPNANEDSSTPNANEDSSTPNANEDSSTPNANEDSSTPNDSEANSSNAETTTVASSENKETTYEDNNFDATAGDASTPNYSESSDNLSTANDDKSTAASDNNKETTVADVITDAPSTDIDVSTPNDNTLIDVTPSSGESADSSSTIATDDHSKEDSDGTTSENEESSTVALNEDVTDKPEDFSDSNTNINVSSETTTENGNNISPDSMSGDNANLTTEKATENSDENKVSSSE